MQYMLATNEIKIAKEWEKYKGFTVRPLPSTIHFYEEIISQYLPEEKFLIYGGTPEIRNIFQYLDYKLTLVDRSEEMVRAMGLLTKSKAPIARNEHFIKSEWLNLSVLNKKFNLIIGDDAINMVKWDDFELFLQNSYVSLEDNGTFICHLLIKPEDVLINKNFQEIFIEYKNGFIRSNYDLASRLNFICFDKNSYAMGWQQTINTIGIHNLEKLKPHFDFLDTFEFCNSKFYCPNQFEFENLVKKYFYIEEIFYPHEHEYCKFEPVYVLKKLKGNFYDR